MSLHYFDHAAATPLDPDVLALMQPYLTTQFYNPSALYAPARTVRQAIEDARHQTAQVLGAKLLEICFTSGGTEANAFAVQGIMRQYPEANCVVSATEHESVLASARLFNHAVAPVDVHGVVELSALQTLINDQTVLVSVMYANNEIGTIQPIRELVKLVASIRASRLQRGITLPLFVHTDACQAANYLDLHVSRLGVDLMTLNGSKLYGPKGTGCLYIRTGTELQILMPGGGQENSWRSGTENVAGIVGFSAALIKAVGLQSTENHRLITLRDAAMQQLAALIPESYINGHRKHRLANNIHCTLPGSDAETVILQLEQQGVLCAAGSACSASNQEPSHVLLAIGMDETAARSSLRITLGRGTDQTAIDALLSALNAIKTRF